MNKKLIVLQNGNKECGSAALLSIIRFFKGDIPLSTLVEMTNTTKEGTNFLNLKEAAYKLGLNSNGYKVEDYQQLFTIENPFIVQFIQNNYTHFVVVYKIKNDKLTIMDPAKGKVVISKQEFLSIWTGYILIFNPYKKLLIYDNKPVLTKLLLDTLLKNKKLILQMFILSLTITIISCILTYYFQIVLDYTLNTNYYNLILITLIFLVVTIFKSVISYCRNELLIYLNQKIDITLILNTFNKILLLPFNYYKNKTTGEIVARVNDIAYVKNFISKLIITVFLDLFICLLSGIVLFNINNNLFGFLVIITLAYLLLVLIFRKINKKLININQENNAKINSLLVETINGFETIKGLNVENNFSKKFEKLYVNSLENNLVYDKVTNILIFSKDLLEGICNIIIIFLGVKLIMNEVFSLGSLLTFNFLTSYYLNPIKSIIELTNEYYQMKNSLNRANSLFEVETLNQKRTTLHLTGNIKVKNLKFQYSNKLILDNINFEIKAKDKVLLLGSSGSGKSTILRLIFKYHNVEREKISFDNNDINDYTVFDIRTSITYISQNEILFNDTIRNNILLDREISDEEFLKVTKITCVNEIVKDDMLGYDKLLEENGLNLSGGQRQRIILARALLKPSKIILIDEGLNELDVNLERKILKNIFKFYSDKTIIIVSHRLNNMDLYSKVLKLENKQINVISKNNDGGL